MNKIILLGRLTNAPEVRYTQGQNGMAIGKFSLAVNRKYKRENEPEADFFNCTAFGKQAEFVEKYLKQGTKILLSGRVQNDNYTNKEGQKVYSVQIIAEEIEFAESKAAASGGGNSFNQDFRPDAPEPNQAADGFMNIPTGLEEELPFS